MKSDGLNSNREMDMWRKVWVEKRGNIRTFYIGLFSGILTGAACSVREIWWMVFFSLIPLCRQLLDNGGKYARVLWGYALGYYVIVFYWLYALASAYPSKEEMMNVLIFFAILIISILLGASIWIAFLPFSYVRRNNSWDIFIVAALYILAEWMQGRVAIIAFPWARLSIIVTPFQAWIQSAGIFGSLGVTGCIVLVNAVLAWLLMKRNTLRRMHISGARKMSLTRPRVSILKAYKKDAGLCFAVLIILGNLLYGILRLEAAGEISAEGEEKRAEVLLVQGNHSGGTKWSYAPEDILDDYIWLSREGITEDTKLIVWPETAIPLSLRERQKIQEELSAFCKEYNMEILTGAFDSKDQEQYNAMFLITSDGMIEETYYKRYLVPFGEYIPYEGIIKNLVSAWDKDYMSEIILTAGEASTVLPSSIGNLGGIICYESIFADTALDAVRKGAEYLVIISNDSWFGASQALREHHAHAILRAVEEKRYVIRASNTGITSVITPYGEVAAQAEEYIPASLRASVFPCEERTVYSWIGDSIVFIGMVLWGIGVAVKIKKSIFK